MLRQQFSELKIRVVNVVDLMVLQPQTEHPHGLSCRRPLLLSWSIPRGTEVMVITENTQGRRREIQMTSFHGAQAEPTDCEDAQDIAVGEDEHIVSQCTDPANDAIGTNAHGLDRFPAGQPSRNRRQPGCSARMSTVRRPSYAP
jgi:hypothetical protein